MTTLEGVAIGEDVLAARMRVSSPPQWIRFLLGLFAVYALFQWSGEALGSDRGQAGLLVAALVVAATLAVECWWSRRNVAAATKAIGLGLPRHRGLVIAAAICALLLLLIPIYARATGAVVGVEAGSLWLLPGLFAQGGIAEETLFRGYLFGHLRVGRTFWRAAALSMLPFVAVHLMLFVSLPFGVALVALVLAVLMSFPLAQLFELSGATIWPSALLHFVVQATVKILVVSGDSSSLFPFVWMVASALLSLCVFFLPRPAASARQGDNETRA